MSFTRRNLLLLAAAVGIAAGPATAYAEGVLNVGSYPNNPPFEFKAESGNFEGFEVDIVTEAAKRIGMTINIEGYDFQPLFRGDEFGPHRRCDFVDHHHAGAPEVAVVHAALLRFRHGHRRQDRQPDQGPRRPQGQDHRRAVRLDRRDLVQGASGRRTASPRSRATTPSRICCSTSPHGRVDAVVSDIPGMEYAFTKMQGLAVKERIKTGEQYGLMMTKDHPLLGKLNDALTEMKKDGTLAAIHKKWFGSDAPAGSSTVTEMPHAQGLSNRTIALTIVPARTPARLFRACRAACRRRRPIFGTSGNEQQERTTVQPEVIRSRLAPSDQWGNSDVSARHLLQRPGAAVQPCRRCCAASSTRCCSG